MRWNENPFFLLSVLTTDNRRTIVAKADELSFTGDGEVITKACESLLNPQKRLNAELSWFPGVPEASLQDILRAFKDGKEIQNVYASGVAKLTCSIYNFTISKEDGIRKIFASLLELDSLFENLTAENVISIINADRQRAAFVLAEKNDVDIGLKRLLDSIKQEISRRVDALPEKEHIKLMTFIADKYIAEHKAGAVFFGLMEHYTLFIQTKLEGESALLLSAVTKIKGLSVPASSQTVNDLVCHVKIWDDYSRPLRVACKAAGKTHAESAVLARELREFAVYLHNERGGTDLAIDLTTVLREIFVELSDFYKLLESDLETLSKIKKEQKEQKEHEEEIVRHKHMDAEYTVTIAGSQYAAPSVCTCCLLPTNNKEHISASITTTQGNTRTTNTLGVDLPICQDCLKHRSRLDRQIFWNCFFALLCGALIMVLFSQLQFVEGMSSFLLGLGIAIGCYFVFGHITPTSGLSSNHTAYQKSVSIQPGFLPVPDPLVAGKYTSGMIFTFSNWQYAVLFKEANKERAGEVQEIKAHNKSNARSVLQAIDHPVKAMFNLIWCFVAVAILISMIPFSSGNESSKTVSKPTVKPPAVQSNNITNANRNADRMHEDIQKEGERIKSMETQLTEMEDTMDDYKAKYESTGKDEYRAKYNSQVDNYNAIYEEYSAAIEDYNEQVKEYNKLYGGG